MKHLKVIGIGLLFLLLAGAIQSIAGTVNSSSFVNLRNACDTAMLSGSGPDTVYVDESAKIMPSDCIPSQHVPWSHGMVIIGTGHDRAEIQCTFNPGADSTISSFYLGNVNIKFVNCKLKCMNIPSLGNASIFSVNANSSYTMQNSSIAPGWPIISVTR